MNKTPVFNFLTSGFFIYVLLPIFSAILGVFVKMVSQNDRYYKFKKEDLAIGMELVLVAIISIITHAVSILGKSVTNSTAVSGKIIYFPWLLTGFILGAWVISTVIRKFGWENETKMNLKYGIIVPILYRLSTVYLSLAWITT